MIARRGAVVDHSKQESWGSYVDGYSADGSLAEQRVFNRDRSRIVSEFKPPGGTEDWDERHTVVLPDGTKFTFENSGNVQRIFDDEGHKLSATEWTQDGPRPPPTGQLAFAGPAAPLVVPLGTAASRALSAAAVSLFTWLSSRKDPNRTAVLAFKARKYEKTEARGQHELSWVGYVKRDELKDVCDKLMMYRATLIRPWKKFSMLAIIMGLRLSAPRSISSLPTGLKASASRISKPKFHGSNRKR
jgi:hypothetical protein